MTRSMRASPSSSTTSRSRVRPRRRADPAVRRRMANLVLDKMLEDIGAEQTSATSTCSASPRSTAATSSGSSTWPTTLEPAVLHRLVHQLRRDRHRPVGRRGPQGQPVVQAIFAPYDEFTKGTLSALEQNDLADVLGYGVDISAADIELMTDEGSPWKATATTDPNAIGAAVLRTLALELAGELERIRWTSPASWSPRTSCARTPSRTWTTCGRPARAEPHRSHRRTGSRRQVLTHSCGRGRITRWPPQATRAQAGGRWRWNRCSRDGRHHDVLRGERGAEGHRPGSNRERSRRCSAPTVPASPP